MLIPRSASIQDFFFNLLGTTHEARFKVMKTIFYGDIKNNEIRCSI